MAIRTYAALIEILTLQKANLPLYLAAVGASAADVTAITNDLVDLTAIQSYADIVDANKQTVFAIKRAKFDGDTGVNVSAWPVNPAAPVLNSPVGGIAQTTEDRNDRFATAPGFTPQIGEALGIPVGSGTPPPPATKPEVIAIGAQMGYLVSVVVSNRQSSTMWQVLVRTHGSTAWTQLGSATGKSADFTYVPAAADIGKPVQLELIVQLRKSNANFGPPSDIILVTLNP